MEHDAAANGAMMGIDARAHEELGAAAACANVQRVLAMAFTD
jgi:hypothetical protein